MIKFLPADLRRLAAALILFGLFTHAGPAGAQTVVDPDILEFAASADHNKTLSSGLPAVDHYEVSFYYQGSSTPFQTNSLGKPTPNSSGVIQVNLDATLPTWPLSTTTVNEARVAAVGPGGTGQSSPSNPFTFSTSSSCTFVLSTASVSMAAGTGTGSLSVNTQTGCAWAAVSNASWITVTLGSSMTGTGFVNFSVTANTSSSARTGTLTVAGMTVTVTQAGTSCSYSLSTTAVSLGSASGSGSVGVTTTSGCSWSAVSSASWLTITAGASGSGSGTVAFAATANQSWSPRTATLTIAGKTVTVTQAASSCAYSLSTTTVSMGSASGTGAVGVTCSSGCSWTAMSNVTWITVTSGSSGSGNGTVAFSVKENGTTSPRTGTLTIGGQTVTLSQAGTACSYTLSTTSASLASTSGTGSVGVTSTTGCSWTAVSNASWITVTSGSSGSGNGTVAFSVTANSSTTSRSGTLTVAGKTVTVTQSAGSCSYSLSATSVSLASTNGTGSVGVTAATGCSWTAVSNASWITVTGGSSGSGNGTVAFSVTANSSTASRSGTLTVAGKTVTVTQAGSCGYTLSTNSVSLPSTSGTGSVGVTTTTGCSWTAASNTSWITVKSGSSGSGNGTVSFSVTANGTTTSRIGTLTIAGKMVTVTQAAGNCSFALSSSGQSFGSGGGSGSVGVTASSTQCQWDASSTANWLTVTSAASGTGTSTVSYAVAPNSGDTALSGTILIGGLTYTVSVAAAAPASTIVKVRSGSELQAAIQSLASDTTIVVAAGSYTLTRTLAIAGALRNVTLRGETTNRNDVVLVGPGMNNTNFGNVSEAITTTGDIDGLTIANLTIRDLYLHAVHLGPRTRAARLSNVRLVNVGQAFVRADADATGAVDDAVVEDSVFERLVAGRDGITTAIRVQGGARWQIRRNVFRNLVAPSGQMGSPAVLITGGATDTIVEQNTFLNCQRGIAYGWTNRNGYDHAGGIIRNNFFYRSASQPGEASIMVVDSPRSEVLHNTILTSGTYATPIEYRYADTVGVLIANNLLDGTIWARDGAIGDDTANVGSAVSSMFVNASAGDLHLVPGAPVVDRALPLADVVNDWDGAPRPVGAAADVGADELAASNRPPTVALTSPVNGAAFTAPASISLSASAMDSDGSVKTVRFYANSTLIGSVSAAPYTVLWKTTQTGTVTLTAVATDNAGARTVSTPVKITVSRKVKGR